MGTIQKVRISEFAARHILSLAKNGLEDIEKTEPGLDTPLGQLAIETWKASINEMEKVLEKASRRRK